MKIQRTLKMKPKTRAQNRRAILAATLLLAFVAPSVAVRAQTANDAERCANEANPDARIAACANVIAAGGSAGMEPATAYDNRGEAYVLKREYDRALQDFSQAIKLVPTSARAFGDRAVAYHNKGDYDHAIADYNQALRLNPTFVVGFNNRGIEYARKGDYLHAIQDFDKAIQLDPKYALALFNRGLARFVLGRFDAAGSDFSAAVQLRTDSYQVLWLHLARARAAQDTQPAFTAAKGLDLKIWPGPALQLFQGGASREDVLKAASNPDAQVQKNRLCQAHFYIGEYELLRNDRTHSLADFRLATGACAPALNEVAAARAELRRLAPAAPKPAADSASKPAPSPAAAPR